MPKYNIVGILLKGQVCLLTVALVVASLVLPQGCLYEARNCKFAPA